MPADSPMSTPAAPYGADRLENTNYEELGASLLSQMHAAGIPSPEIMQLHPLAAAARSVAGNGHATDQSIIGNSNAHILQSIRENIFNKYFPNQPAGSTVPITLEAFDAYNALHETTHYIARHITDKNGVTLEGQVYSSVNRLATPHNVRDNLDLHGDAARVADDTYGLIPEAIADGGAALYTLSNYHDGESAAEFYRHISDLRRATPDVEGSHATSPYIDAALQAYQAHPRRGLSIVETTQWAAEIVRNAPQLNKSIEEMAADNRADMLSSMAITAHPEDPSRQFQDLQALAPQSLPPPDIRAKAEQDIVETTNARNRFFGTGEQFASFDSLRAYNLAHGNAAAIPPDVRVKPVDGTPLPSRP